MKKRKRITMLLSVTILAAVIVFLIMHGPAGPGGDTGDENTMRSSDDEVQVVWGDSAGDRRMPEFNSENVKEYAYYGFHEVKQTPLVNYSFEGLGTIGDPIVNRGSIPGIGRLSGPGSASLIDGRFGLGQALHFSGKDSWLSAPDLGQLDALTVSFWVKLRDVRAYARSKRTRIKHDTGGLSGGTPPD